MSRPILVIIVFMVVTGLVAGPFAEAFVERCRQECDCCREACSCEPLACASGWQPIIETEADFLFFDLFPRQSHQYAYLLPHSDEAIRSVFRPPRKHS